MGERSAAYTVFVGKSEENLTRGKTSSKYEDNKMDHNEKNRIVWPRFMIQVYLFLDMDQQQALVDTIDRFPAGSRDFTLLQSFESGSDVQYLYSTLLKAPSQELKWLGSGTSV